MKSLILGGSGFVGQHLVARLEAEGHQVKIYDKVLPKHGSGIHANIQDLEMLTSYMRGMDIVFHLASNADISKAATDPTLDFIEGTQLTQKVLEAMRISGVNRLVYFSGSGVYGEPEEPYLCEDYSPMHPISPYGASKLASEAMISAYVRMFGLTAIVLRPANIVGPGQTHGVGFDFIRRLAKEPNRLTVLGDGSQTKSYVHIEDVIDAVMLTLSKIGSGLYVFNVSTDDGMSVKEIAEMAACIAGDHTCEILYGMEDRGWNGDVPRISFDCARLHRLGWSPQHNSRTAMLLALKSMYHENIH